ncbi:hypothetical protein [Lentzea sp. NPDC092896]|uniref:hypothetical protein n=1 Tax=Lentzea sp. NPDC092896 TaxID=3364127 RepID=UPI00380777FC
MKSSSSGPLSRLAAVQHSARDALGVVGLALFVILACVVTKTSAAVVYALAVLLGVAVLLIIVTCCLVAPRVDEKPRRNGKKLP